MATNDFLVFAGGSGANTLDQASYNALAARLNGFQAGIAKSPELNKVWRQSSIAAAVLGAFISSRSGQNAVDDGTTANLVTNFELALTALQQNVSPISTAGTPPAFTLSPSVAITAYTNQRFRVVFSGAGTTGSNTINVSGLGAKSLKQYDATGAKVDAIITSGMRTSIEYDGTDFVVLEPLPSSNSAYPAGAIFPYSGIDQPAWGLPLLGGAVSRATYPKLFAVLCPAVTATTTASSAVITVPSTLHWYAGMPVEDARFAAGTTVTSIDSSTTATLSNTASAGGSGSLRAFLYGYGAGGNSGTFGLPLGAGNVLRAYDGGRGREQWTLTGNLTASSNIVTGIASTKGILIGSTVSHASITGGTATVTKITANIITLSATATAAVTYAALVVSGMAIGAEGNDAMQGHWHGLNVYTTSGDMPGGAGYRGLASYNNIVGPNDAVRAPISDGTNGTPRTGPETTVKRLTVGMYICHGEAI